MGKYKRVSNRQSWKEGDMTAAMECIKNNEMGWLKASKIFNVPQATLRRRFKAGNSKKKLGRFENTFSPELEKQLVDHILMLESRLFGLTTVDVKKLAYDLAEKLKIKHRFSQKKGKAGWDWLHNFQNRHPQLSLRQPEATSLARASAFNKPQVSRYFALLQKTIDEEKISPDRIYNMDESGLSTVQRPPKIFAAKGKKQVGALTSAERGAHVTVVLCLNAIGQYIPPAIIFPRKRFNPMLYDDAPPGTLKLHNESGYMVGELFHQYIQHFVAHTKPTPEQKVLLILDGHSSHKDVDALDYAKNKGVIFLCLPPHCTHRLQPLDVAVYGPLSTYYNQEIAKWLRNNPGRTVTLFQVSKLFREAYFNAATVKNAISGFSATGTHPFNPDIFPHHLYAPAETTNVEEEPHTQCAKEDENKSEESNTSHDDSRQTIGTDNSTEQIISELSPVPHVEEKVQKRKSRTQKSGILTQSPLIAEMKEKARKKKEKENKKTGHQKKKEKEKEVEESKGSRELRKVGRKLFSSLGNEEESDKDFSGDEDDNDVACLYCNDLFSRSKSKEKWLRCMTCSKWCHADCSGLSPRTESFICELCL